MVTGARKLRTPSLASHGPALPSPPSATRAIPWLKYMAGSISHWFEALSSCLPQQKQVYSIVECVDANNVSVIVTLFLRRSNNNNNRYSILYRHAHLSVSVERGHGLTRDLACTRPADILIAGLGQRQTCGARPDHHFTTCSAILSESCHQVGAAALAAEARKLFLHSISCGDIWRLGQGGPSDVSFVFVKK